MRLQKGDPHFGIHPDKDQRRAERASDFSCFIYIFKRKSWRPKAIKRKEENYIFNVQPRLKSVSQKRFSFV